MKETERSEHEIQIFALLDNFFKESLVQTLNSLDALMDQWYEDGVEIFDREDVQGMLYSSYKVTFFLSQLGEAWMDHKQDQGEDMSALLHKLYDRGRTIRSW